MNELKKSKIVINILLILIFLTAVIRWISLEREMERVNLEHAQFKQKLREGIDRGLAQAILQLKCEK